MIFNPVFEDNKERDPEYSASLMPVVFNSGENKLIGTVFIANGKGPHPLLVLLHGFPGNESNYDIAHAARRAGWNVLVFHYRGSWGSAGIYSFSNCLEDVDDVLKSLADPKFEEKYRIDSNKIVLAGHSLGGFISLIKLCENGKIKYGASFGGFNFGFFAKMIPAIPEAKEITLEGLNNGAYLLNGVSGDNLYNEMLKHCDNWDLLEKSDCFAGKNILLIGAQLDNVAPATLHHIPLLKKIESVKGVQLEHHTLDTGHSFSDRRIELTTILIEWLNKIRF